MMWKPEFCPHHYLKVRDDRRVVCLQCDSPIGKHSGEWLAWNVQLMGTARCVDEDLG